MKKIIGGVAAVVLAVAAVSVPVAAYATDSSVDINETCQIQYGIGYQAKLLDPHNAYSWRCWVPPYGVQKSVNVQLYCTAFGEGSAVVLDPGNAYSWRCRS